MFDPNTKILIADDMMTMRKLVKKACTNLGYKNFVEAKDGAEAWTMLNAEPDVGLVISDWNMPNSSGLDFLKRVRSNGPTKDLPFILLTAESEASQVKTALEAGVDNYIVKPFTPEILKSKIEVVYKKRNAA